jgi:fatty acid desaturase
MLDHTRFLATVPPATRDRLTSRSNAPALIHAALHVTLITALATWIALGWPGWPLAVPCLGVALAFLFTLQHECTHKTPFRTAWLNEVVGHVAGLILIQPFQWFRAFHMAHHRFTNDPARDPELATQKPVTRVAILWHLVGLGYWWSKLTTLLSNAFGPLDADYIPPRHRTRIRAEARLMIVAYLALAWLAGPLLFWIWLLPLALGFPVLRLYLLAEHGLCPPVANMFENTRTTFSNRVVRWLSWNMPYHAEHHAWPAVPYHALPALHRLSAPHLQSTSDSYSAFTKDYLQSVAKDTVR